MKFRNITGSQFDAYGYRFPPGVDVDVTEDNLIRKFSLYYQFESHIEGEFEKEPTREELKKKADEMGIEYSPKIRTATLKELVN